MAKASGDKFFIENILGLKDEEPAILSPVSKGQKRRRLSDESEDEASSSFRSDTDKTSSDTDKRSNDADKTSSDDDIEKDAKRRRIAFTNTQVHCLESLFAVCPYPDADTRIRLAKDNCISPTKVQVWFQNRRARYRKREGLNRPLRRSLDLSQTCASYYYSKVVRPTLEAKMYLHNYYASLRQAYFNYVTRQHDQPNQDKSDTINQGGKSTQEESEKGTTPHQN